MKLAGTEPRKHSSIPFVEKIFLANFLLRMVQKNLQFSCFFFPGYVPSFVLFSRPCHVRLDDDVMGLDEEDMMDEMDDMDEDVGTWEQLAPRAREGV